MSFLISDEVRKELDKYQQDLSNKNFLLSQVSPSIWPKIVSEHSLSTVLIQSFQDNNLIKQGNGIILSSDGVIVSTSDVVPGAATIYQVIYGDKIFKAAVVFRDTSQGLVLLKVDASDLTVSTLDTEDFQSGQELIIVGRITALLKAVVFSQKALVSFVVNNTMFLDTAFSNSLNGMKVVNERGEVLGMVKIKSGKVSVISPKIIGDFFNSYLNSKK